MNRYWKIIFFIFSSQALGGSLTRDDLLRDCPIPEKRPLPLSKEIKPCDNFYEYVCHDSIQQFELPLDRSAWYFSFTDAAERLLYAKKQYFKGLEKGIEPALDSAKQIKNFYLSCMNETASKIEEKQLVQKEMETILALKSRDDFAELGQERIDKSNISYLGFETGADQDDPDLFDAIISADMKSLPEPSYYEKKETVKALTGLIEDFFKTLGFKNFKERAQWVIAFEKSLAKVYPKPAILRDRFAANTYQPREVWVKKYPHLRLGRILNKIPKNIRLRDLVPESLEFFEEAVRSYPLEQLQSVLMFHSIRTFMDDAYPEHYAKSFKFNHRFLGGPEKRPDRQERCTREAMDHFPMELDQELLPILFPNFPQDKVIELAEKVRASIVQGLNKNSWLSVEGKRGALKKISGAKLYLVQPRTEREWNFNYPADYSLTLPYANRSLWREKSIEKTFDELKGPRDRTQWGMGPLTLNAYYSPPDNKFVMLLGILQYPFFDSSMNPIEQTAAIGAVMGHELGHSIDDKGSRYDADGKLKQWMTEADLREFTKRSQAFVERFNRAGHDGKLTLGENIGDHVGVFFAYDAAFPDTDGATVQDKQEFFRAYAKLWCGKVRPEYEKMLLKLDSHALGRARVNEQVIQHPGFYDAFQCKSGDRMFVEPKDRIKVW